MSARPERIIKLLNLPLRLKRLPKSIERSSFSAEGASRRTLSLSRENLDHTRRRAWPVECALRSAHDLDPRSMLSVVRSAKFIAPDKP